MMQTGPRLVSLSFLLPYSGVDHAGGQLLLQHYRVLAKRCSSLTAFGIAFDGNLIAARRAADIGSASYTATAIEFPRWRKTLLGKIIARLGFIMLPVLPDIGVCSAFGSSQRLREQVLAADIVEMQWFEYLYFAWLVHRINPLAQIIGFVHDIPSQKLERRLAHWPAPLRRPYLAYVAWLERLLLRNVPTAIVLSTKDAALVARRSPATEIVVVDPPLDLGRWRDGAHRRDITVPDHGGADTSFGFIAAFQRSENDDAGLWLLTDIWPRVLARCPVAHLYLVGSTPSDELRAVAGRFEESVTVTGYLDDIDGFYDRFSTVVIPLRHGAGVKFKTVSGILAGKNIVATPVAVEGTIASSLFFTVSDSAETLAQAMVELATNPDLGRDTVEKARQEIGSRYSLENYARAVLNAYSLGTQSSDSHQDVRRLE